MTDFPAGEEYFTGVFLYIFATHEIICIPLQFLYAHVELFALRRQYRVCRKRGKKYFSKAPPGT